jgi:hypothetical protein
VIRRAGPEDVEHIAGMAVKFHAYSPWREVPLDLDAVRNVALACIERGAIFVTEDGMCGGVVQPLYFSPQTTIGAEFFWWAPTQGGELRAAFEAWAREQGAYAVQFSALGDDRAAATARLYRMAGFEPAETVYLKRL